MFLKGVNGILRKKHLGFSTKSIHTGYDGDPTTGATAVPIYQTASYKFKSLEHAQKLFNLEEEGFIYSRITNPTVSIFEKKMAELEGGSCAVAFSSGQAAVYHIITALCKTGDHIVTSSDLYGGTAALFNYFAEKFNINVSFVSIEESQNLESYINKNTKLLFVETIGNPNMSVPDFKCWAEVSKKYNIPLAVDNTFATPYLCKPIEYGANIVIHSATKYICGTGTTMGGVIIDGGNFDWKKDDKFPQLSKPNSRHHDICFADKFGNKALGMFLKVEELLLGGACMSPFNAFLLIEGLKTLELRMKRHSENALKVATFLENHKAVEWVSYPLLETSKYYKNAKKYLTCGASGMLSFGIKGGIKEGALFLENLKLIKHVANVGDATSLAVHPASTTHHALSKEELKKLGISENFIRLSIGLENIDDIISDLDRALKVVLEEVN